MTPTIATDCHCATTTTRVLKGLATVWEASGRVTDEGENAQEMHFGTLFARVFVRYSDLCRSVFAYLTDDEYRDLECAVAACDIASARGRIEDDYDAVRHDIVNRLRGEVGIGYRVTVSDGEGGWEIYTLMATSYQDAERTAERAAGVGHATRVVMTADRVYQGVQQIDAGTDD